MDLLWVHLELGRMGLVKPLTLPHSFELFVFSSPTIVRKVRVFSSCGFAMARVLGCREYYARLGKYWPCRLYILKKTKQKAVLTNKLFNVHRLRRWIGYISSNVPSRRLCGLQKTV